jgi:hypothetical protein
LLGLWSEHKLLFMDSFSFATPMWRVEKEKKAAEKEVELSGKSSARSRA